MREMIGAIAALVSGALLLVATAPAASAEPPSSAPTASARSQTPSFVLHRGDYRSFEAADPTVQLAAGDITDSGVIVGEYLTPTREAGFRRDARGRITRIDLAGAAGTQVDKTNRRGQIVGNSSRVSPFLPGDGSRGYVLDRGKLTRINVPRAKRTIPHGINDQGVVVGGYVDTEGNSRGFRWIRGRYKTFAVPDAAFTEPLATNNHGQIVGVYGDTNGVVHGFLLEHREYTTLDVIGATVSIPFDINNRGQVVISAFSPTADDPNAGARGFVLREGPGGPFTEIRFPGAPKTLVTGLDDRGRVVGIYQNPNASAQPTRMAAFGSRALACGDHLWRRAVSSGFLK
jgi:uncharacterized membrane protein